MNTFKYILIIIGIVAIGLLGYFVGGKYDYEKIEQLLTKKEIITQYDTTFVFKSDTIKISKEFVKTYFYNSIDTIFITKEFEKNIDTTINDAQINVSYFFPQDSFKIKLRNKITEIVRTDTIKTFLTIPQYKDDYVKIGSVGLAGVGVGLLIGVIISK